MSSVLIGCGQHQSKEYSFERWLQSVTVMAGSSDEILVVDNSNGLDFYERWCGRVPMVHIEVKGNGNLHIAAAMEYLRQYFLKSSHEWWLNVESDMVLPPETLSLMLLKGKGFDFVTVPYYSRTEPGRLLENSFGCALFSRNLCEGVTFQNYPADVGCDGYFNQNLPMGYRTLVVKSALELEHL